MGTVRPQPALATVFINYSINSEAIDHRSSTIQHINPSAGVVSNGLLIRNHTTLTLAVGGGTVPVCWPPDHTADRHSTQRGTVAWILAPARHILGTNMQFLIHNTIISSCGVVTSQDNLLPTRSDTPEQCQFTFLVLAFN